MFSRDQYEAARHRAAVVNRSSRGKIVVRGVDRASFLHALLTNDIARLTPGTGTYSAYLTPHGRMISDMRVIEVGDAMILDVEPFVSRGLADRLNGLVFSEDVQAEDVSDQRALVGVCGPLAAEVLSAAIGAPAEGLLALGQYDNMTAAQSLVIVRDDFLGVPGFDVYVPGADAGPFIRSLVEAGGLTMAEETAEVLRVEAGRPRFGVDMDTDTIPLEAGIEDRAISLTKGCYVGQEVIVRVLHRGHGRVARRLVVLELSGVSVPEPGAAVLTGEQEIGRLTTATFSPMTGSPLALGYVQRDYASPGTLLSVKSGGGVSEAKVRQLVK